MMSADISLPYTYTPRSRLHSLARDPSFHKDALLLGELPEEIIVRVREALEQHLFFEPGTVRQCITDATHLDDATTDALVVAFTYLPRLSHDIAAAGGDFQALLRNAIEKSDAFENVDPSRLDAIIERVGAIAEPTNAQRFQWKAERLATAVGFPLQSLEFVTDMRPVYDDGRSVIRGFVPVTTLVMTTGEGKEVVASITEGQLDLLATEIERAINKVRTAKETAKEHGYPVAQITRGQ